MPRFKIGNTVPDNVIVADKNVKVVGVGDKAVWAKFDPLALMLWDIVENVTVQSDVGFDLLIYPRVTDTSLTRLQQHISVSTVTHYIEMVINVERGLYTASQSANLVWRLTTYVTPLNSSAPRVSLGTLTYTESGAWNRDTGTISTASKKISFMFQGANSATTSENDFKADVIFEDISSEHTIGHQRISYTGTEIAFDDIRTYKNGYPKLTITPTDSFIKENKQMLLVSKIN